MKNMMLYEEKVQSIKNNQYLTQKTRTPKRAKKWVLNIPKKASRDTEAAKKAHT